MDPITNTAADFQKVALDLEQKLASSTAENEALRMRLAAAPSKGISKLAAALSKAQGAMEGATKDKYNPAFKGEGKPKGSSYADLAAVWDAIRKPLSDNGLCVIQLTVQTDAKSVAVETQLHHESGEMISSTIVIPLSKTDAHGVLGALTYGRRGGLMAMVGVAAEDDDGNTAAGKTADGKDAAPAQTQRSSSKPEAVAKVETVNPRVAEFPAALKAATSLHDLMRVGDEVAAAVKAKQVDGKTHAELTKLFRECKAILEKPAGEPAAVVKKFEKKEEPAPEPGSGG